MSLTLYVLAGPDAGLRHPLERPLLVGRDPACDLVLKDPEVAARHVRLIPDGQAMQLQGVDGEVVYGDVVIREGRAAAGAVFRVGRTVVRLHPAAPPATRDHFGDVVGRSPLMQAIYTRLERVAPSDLSVLIEGETGTGKDLVARALHRHSPRRHRPFVVLDCSAIPHDLIESTLFGHERGAFTGAVARQRGLFEQADGGTIFLDEIGELTPALQPRLLRVLERGELKRVGGDETIRVDVRVIAATHRDLGAMVGAGAFREDLYFRVGVVRLHLPPLRARPDDIPLLVERFLDDAVEAGRPRLRVTAPAMAALTARRWPGNVRELRNALARASSLGDGPLLDVDDLMLGAEIRRGSPLEPDLAAPFKRARRDVLDRFEVVYLEGLLGAHEGNISRSARAAGLTRYYLRELLKKHGLHGP